MKLTLSEALARAKQTEGEIFRISQRKSLVINRGFSEQENMGKKEEYSAAEYKKKQDAFLKEKKAELANFDKELEKKIGEAIKLRSKINKANIDSGLDEKLVRMKWLRIRLDGLMQSLGYSKKSLYSIRETPERHSLGLDDQLDKIEKEKSQLDAEIQKLNHVTMIEL